MLIIENKDFFHQDTDDQILIRSLIEDDVTDSYVKGINDSQVNTYLVGARRKKQTLEDVRSFVKLNQDDDTGFLFGLFVGHMLRGTCRLHEINKEAAYLGIAIFDRNIWGKSYGTSLIKAVSYYGVHHLGLEKVEALIHEDNIASIKAFEKANFSTNKSKDELKDGIRFKYFVYN